MNELIQHHWFIRPTVVLLGLCYPILLLIGILISLAIEFRDFCIQVFRVFRDQPREIKNYFREMKLTWKYTQVRERR